MVSTHISACSSVTPGGIFASVVSASGIRNRSANTPGWVLPSWWPENGFPAWRSLPSWIARARQSGVMAGTATISPGEKSRTWSPTSRIRATHS